MQKKSVLERFADAQDEADQYSFRTSVTHLLFDLQHLVQVRLDVATTDEDTLDQLVAVAAYEAAVQEATRNATRG